jgi:hypothetical protein
MATDRKSSQKPAEAPPKFTAHFAEPTAAPRVFNTTWIVASAAAAIGLVAAYVFLRPSSKVGEPEDVVSDGPTPEAETESKAKSPAPPLPANPLEIAKLALDARSLARTWQRDAELSEFRLDIVGGKPLDLRFLYGVPRGPYAPGVVLKPQLFELSFVTTSAPAKSRETTATTPGSAASDPNCPLHAAYRAALQSGLSDSESIQGHYGYSSKHNREIWSFSSGSKKPTLVDANSCAILVR